MEPSATHHRRQHTFPIPKEALWHTRLFKIYKGSNEEYFKTLARDLQLFNSFTTPQDDWSKFIVEVSRTHGTVQSTSARSIPPKEWTRVYRGLIAGIADPVDRAAQCKGVLHTYTAYSYSMEARV
jgi:hypothetical protein